MERKHPNILLIMTDQQRFDSLGCYGNQAISTPNLDSLAEDGILFENCYVDNPVCTPSRASLLTGKYIQGHGVRRLHDNLPDREVLIPERLRQAGYHTALFGKLHVCGNRTEAVRRHPNDGFDVYEWTNEGCMNMGSDLHAYRKWLEKKDPEFCARLQKEQRGTGHIPAHLHMTCWASQRAVEYIETQKGDQPFFCMVSLFDPHNPYHNYPLDMASAVDAGKIPDPIPPDTSTKCIYALNQEHRNSYLGGFDDYSHEDILNMRFGYNAAVAFIDQQVGRILRALEARRFYDDTLIIFTSDHGDMLGDHGLLVKGAFFYEPNVKVPLLMHWPKQIGGERRSDALVQIHDLAATILDAAGIDAEEVRRHMPASKSLLPVARGDASGVRSEAVCCYRNTGIKRDMQYWDPEIHATMIRTGNYKLSVYHTPDHAGFPEKGQLFNVCRDPEERTDLWHAPQQHEIREMLLHRLTSWLSQNDPDFSQLPGTLSAAGPVAED